jgi:hypothetical protein
MAISKPQLIKDFAAYVSSCGGDNSDWYVGISRNPQRLFTTGHHFAEKGGLAIWREAESAAIARQLETYFLDVGFDGGRGDADPEAEWVYAYKKTPKTSPKA